MNRFFNRPAVWGAWVLLILAATSCTSPGLQQPAADASGQPAIAPPPASATQQSTPLPTNAATAAEPRHRPLVTNAPVTTPITKAPAALTPSAAPLTNMPPGTSDRTLVLTNRFRGPRPVSGTTATNLPVATFLGPPAPGAPVSADASTNAASAAAAPPVPIRAPSAPPAFPQLPAPPSRILPPGTNVPPAIAGAAQPPAAMPPPADLPTILPGTIDVQNMPLDQFFDLYAKISDRTVLRPYQLAGAPQGVTLKAQTALTVAEAIQAMDATLALNNVAMITVGDKFVKAVPANTAPQEGSQLSSARPAELEDGENFVTQIVHVETLKPSELASLLTTFTRIPNGVVAFDNNNTLVIRDHASNVKRMLEVVEKVDVRTEPDYKLEVIPIKYGKVIDLHSTMQGLITGQAAASFGAGAAGAAMGGMQGGAGRYGAGASGRASRYGGRGGYGAGGYGAGGYGGGYGAGGYGGGYGGGYYPQQVAPAAPAAPTVGASRTSFQQRLNQIVSRAAGGEEVQVLEDARIFPDERSNSLLVYANKRDMEMITNIVSKVDVLLAQVLIEAIIMEVQLRDDQNVGVSVAQSPRRFGQDFIGGGGINSGQSFLNSITNFTSGLPNGFSYFGRIGDDFDIVVNAIATDRAVNVISRPRIQTSHAIPGNFFIGETVPYITGFTDYGGYVGGGLSTRSSIVQEQIGFSLIVTPFITPEGFVVMEISQNFDSRGADVIIENNPIPVINQRQADATLTVRDGDTILMGGFISSTKTRSKSGVPFLKDIPGLGVLFRSKGTSDDRTELIILMRATVLASPEQAAIIATAEKSQLPGIQQAEREFKEGEQKRREKFKRQKW